MAYIDSCFQHPADRLRTHCVRLPFRLFLDFAHFTGRKTKAQRGQALPNVTRLVDRLKPKLCHQDGDDSGENTDYRVLQQALCGSVTSPVAHS